MATLARKLRGKQQRRSLKKILVDRVKERIRKKRGPLTPPFELEYRHVFVLPSKFGTAFGFMLIFMVLGGLNFNNNMALMLVFLLGTITQMTTLLAYRNLAGLNIDDIHAEPVFCGESARFMVFVTNKNDRQRFSILAGFEAPQDCQDIGINSCIKMQLTQPTTKRGWLEMPAFRLETRFPLGMFKAWSWIFPQCRVLVYPQPASTPPALPDTGKGNSGQARKGEGDQIHGLRKYQPGDSKQRIAWRASARHDEFYSLDLETPREQACELNWDLLTGVELESRLAILTAWIIAADHKQLPYSLKIPGETIAANDGPEHRSRCLELLALFRT